MPTINCSRFIIAGAAAVALTHAAITAHAQAAYPAKTVRIIVGMVPGGFTDTSTRIVGSKLAAALGQQILVENRPGANAYIAADRSIMPRIRPACCRTSSLDFARSTHHLLQTETCVDNLLQKNFGAAARAQQRSASAACAS